MLRQFQLITTFSVDLGKLRSFLKAVSFKYLDNPFHNFCHGAPRHTPAFSVPHPLHRS